MESQVDLSVETVTQDLNNTHIESSTTAITTPAANTNHIQLKHSTNRLIKQLNAKIRDLENNKKQELESFTNQIKKHGEWMKEMDDRLGKVKGQNAQLKKNASRMDSGYEQLRKKLVGLEGEMEELKEELAVGEERKLGAKRTRKDAELHELEDMDGLSVTKKLKR